jgi:hypothetical protein
MIRGQVGGRARGMCVAASLRSGFSLCETSAAAGGGEREEGGATRSNVTDRRLLILTCSAALCGAAAWGAAQHARRGSHGCGGCLCFAFALMLFATVS